MFLYHDALFFISILFLTISAATSSQSMRNRLDFYVRLKITYREHVIIIFSAYVLIYFLVHGLSFWVVADWVLIIFLVYILAKYMKNDALIFISYVSAVLFVPFSIASIIVQR